MYLAKGYFPLGSIGLKTEPAILFIESGEKTVITSVELGKDGLEGKAGTTVSR